MKKWIVLALLSVTLAACGGSGGEPNPPTKVAKVVEEKEFKPIPYKETKADGVCSANGGFKSCYGLAFECSDGAKIKPEKAYCMDGNYIAEGATEEPTIKKLEATKSKETPQEFCASFSKLAGTVMSGRQNGILMSDAMRLAGDSKMIQAMVSDAYKQPAFSSTEYKEKAVREFTDQAYSICWKNFG